MSFRFRSSKPGIAAPSSFGAFSFSFGTDAKATGTLTGSMAYSNGRGGCPGFSKPEDFSVPTTACGAQLFSLRVQGQWKGGFISVTGDDDITFAARPDRGRYADCPFPSPPPPLMSRDGTTTACDKSLQAPLWRATNELAGLGRGLANVRLSATPKSLKSPRKRVTVLSRRVRKHCTIPIHNASAPMTVDVTTQLSVSLKQR